MTKPRGFTLLEVMVAMAITALGLSATYYAVMQSIGSIDRLQNKTFAHWIALNQLTEMRSQRETPKVGDSEGDVEFANQYWVWRATVSETQVENLYRVDLAVAFEDSPDHVVSDVVGFIGPPLITSGQILPWSAEPAEKFQ